jgi:mRNA interferase RelE/StbE
MRAAGASRRGAWRASPRAKVFTRAYNTLLICLYILRRVAPLANIATIRDIAAVKTIVLSPGAAKAFDRLTPFAQRQISDALDAYAMNGIGDAKAMVGTPTIRLRVGDYRIIFDEDATRIVVLALGDRKDIYR